jgi:hypothetical protein
VVPAWGSPEPAAPGAPERGGEGAYVVKPTTGDRSLRKAAGLLGLLVVLGGFVSGLGVSALGLLLLAWPLGRHFFDAGRGTAWFTVDAAGVSFGRIVLEHAEVPVRDAPVRWSWIGSVVVFPVTRLRPGGDDGYRTLSRSFTAVGVTRRGDPDRRVVLYQVFEDHQLDRPALAAAVARFGGGVPVVDGPERTRDDRPARGHEGGHHA